MYMGVNWLKLLNNLYSNRDKFKEAILDLLSSAYLRVYLVAVLSLNLIDWLAVYFINKNLSQNLVILHYNVNLGVNLIGDASRVYIIPLLGLVFVLLNFILLLNIYKQNKFFIHLLMSSSVLANIFLLISTAAVYLINFR